jgi:hypothetical protein
VTERREHNFLSIQQKHKSSKGDCVWFGLRERPIQFCSCPLILHFLTLHRSVRRILANTTIAAERRSGWYFCLSSGQVDSCGINKRLVFHLARISNPPIGEVIQSNNQGLLELKSLLCLPECLSFSPWCVRRCSSRDNFGTGEIDREGVSVIASLHPKSIGLLRVRLRMSAVDRWQKEKKGAVHSFEIRKSSACDCTHTYTGTEEKGTLPCNSSWVGYCHRNGILQ